MKKSNTNLIAISLLLALTISACSLSFAEDIKPPAGYQPPVYEDPEVLTGAAPETSPNPENGQAIYTEKCAPCHGGTGLGDGPDSTSLPNPVSRIGAANVANLATPLEWFSIILQGNLERFMPPFSGSLSDQDVWDVLAFVYTLSVEQDLVAAGEAQFETLCAACHGLDGSGGEMPGAADLLDAERMVMLSIDDLVQKIATGSGNDGHVFSTELDAAQIEAAAYFVRSLTFPLVGEPVTGDVPGPTAIPIEEAAETPVVGSEDTSMEEPPAEEDGTVTITGVITNGFGSDLPDGLEIRLEVYQNFEVLFTETTQAESDGSYLFEAVEYDPNLIYITVIELNGTFFPSEFHMGGEVLEGQLDLPITIYDLTTDTADLVVSRLHVFIQLTENDSVQIVHQVSISNLGNALVAPASDSDPVLNFTLPEGATNLVFQSGTLGNPYVGTETGFADPTPIQPGENAYELLFAYDLPVAGGLEWEIPLDLAARVAVVFVEGEDTKVSSDTLTPSGIESFDTSTFQVLVAEGLAPGDRIDLQIKRSIFANGSSQSVLSVILGAVGLGLAAFGAWRFFAVGKDTREIDPADREEIIESIIALDELYEEGEVDEAAYQKKRQALKDELQGIIDQESAD